MTIFSTYLILGIISGMACFILAKEKQKNPFAWFILGFIGSIFSIAILAFISKSIQKK